MLHPKMKIAKSFHGNQPIELYSLLFLFFSVLQVWPASRKMSVALFAFYFLSLVSTSETTGEQCKVYQVPLRGKALCGHTYRTAKAGELFRCYVRCERDPSCKSCNFKHKQEICEMNNETKETKPDDFITDEQSYYIKRTGGGVYNSKRLSVNHRRKPEVKILHARTLASSRFFTTDKILYNVNGVV